MPTSSLGQRDVPHVILSCCSFQHHLAPGVDVFKHTKLVKTYKTCHESPPGRRIMDFFFPNFLFYLKEQNQEKRKKLHPSGQRTWQTLFVPGHPDFHCADMRMLPWQKRFFLSVRQPGRFMICSLSVKYFCSKFSFFLGMFMLLQNGTVWKCQFQGVLLCPWR